MRENNNSKKEKNNIKNKEKAKKILLYVISGIVLLALLGSLIFVTIKENKEKGTVKEGEISYTELIKQIDEGNVEKIQMTVGSTTIKVNLKGEEKPKTGIVPSTQAFIELVQEKVQEGNQIELIQNKQGILTNSR